MGPEEGFRNSTFPSLHQKVAKGIHRHAVKGNNDGRITIVVRIVDEQLGLRLFPCLANRVGRSYDSPVSWVGNPRLFGFDPLEPNPAESFPLAFDLYLKGIPTLSYSG